MADTESFKQQFLDFANRFVRLRGDDHSDEKGSELVRLVAAKAGRLAKQLVDAGAEWLDLRDRNPSTDMKWRDLGPTVGDCMQLERRYGQTPSLDDDFRWEWPLLDDDDETWYDTWHVVCVRVQGDADPGIGARRRVMEESYYDPEERPHFWLWTEQNAADWRQQAEDYATVCQAIAARCRCEIPDTPDVASADTAIRPDYAFREVGASMEVIFSEERGMINASMLGCRYIRQLLMSPNKPIGSQTLRGEVASASDANPMNDRAQETLNVVLGKLREIEGELESARSVNDTLVVDELESEKRKLVDFVKKESGLGGKARSDASKAANAARSAVTQAIAWFYKKLDPTMPLCVAFFKQHIQTGASCRYSPPNDPPDWHF